MKKILLIASALFTGNLFSQFFSPDTVPVIFHVIHAGEAVGVNRNLAQVRINSQIKVLNEDFAGQGWNVNQVPAVWAGLVANTGITFVPALIDPNGNILSEPGIHRVPFSSIPGLASPGSMGYSTNTIDNTIKPNTIWDTGTYCNIWVTQLQNGLLGYTPMAPLINATNDGVTVDYRSVGDTLNNFYPYNHGRTATHEFGHWLGLRHLNNNCQPQAFPDIPAGHYENILGPVTYPSNPCPGDTDGCMFMNFMFFLPDSCLYMFTAAQGNAMKLALATNHPGVRNSTAGSLNSIGISKASTKNLSVYPNPSDGSFTVSSSDHATGAALVTVYNLLGKEVCRMNLDFEKGRSKVNLNQLEQGIYYLEVTSKAVRQTVKFVIE